MRELNITVRRINYTLLFSTIEPYHKWCTYILVFLGIMTRICLVILNIIFFIRFRDPLYVYLENNVYVEIINGGCLI